MFTIEKVTDMLTSVASGSPKNQYTLIIDGIDAGAGLSVLSIEGQASLNQPWRYDITFTTSNKQMAIDAVLSQAASLTFEAPSLISQIAQISSLEKPTLPHTLYGVITEFSLVSVSKDEVRYRVTLQPRLALFANDHFSAIYQNQSVVSVVEEVLRRHGFTGIDYRLELKDSYPAREFITQWQESDLAFIQRLLADVGIWFRFESHSDHHCDVLVLSDYEAGYENAGHIILKAPSGMVDGRKNSVWDLQFSSYTKAKEIITQDYNYRTADSNQYSLVNADSKDSTTQGTEYRYGEHYKSKGDNSQIESGQWYANIRHEAHLSQKMIIQGECNDYHLLPGQRIIIDNSGIAGINEGIIILSTQSYADRSDAYQCHFTAIPYDVLKPYRPMPLPWPQVTGTLPARVTSPDNDTYGYIDTMGRYRVKFDFDLKTWKNGEESLWVRLAKPYAGSTYGFHFPLIDGTGVAIAFSEGNPDRPYIAHALHDSTHPDHVTTINKHRNVIRTPANNKLRMDDKRGQEHIKLATEYGKTQLNIGHLVDQNKEQRGEGFELHTDEWGAIAANKGLYLTSQTEPKAEGKQLDMQGAIAQLENALSIAKALQNAAIASDAHDANSKIYCIADGEVIAYRSNDIYQKLDYGDKVGFFSTGFVLVRHLLEMERVEEETNSTKTEKQKQPPHRLYFYSLYMHLADKAFYEKNSKEPVPAFWQQDIYQVKDKYLQYIKGLNCRKEPDPQNNLNRLAVLQTGTKLKLNLDINREGKSGKMWYAVSSLVEGYSTIPQLEPIPYQHETKTVDILGWVNTGDKVDDPIFEVKESGDTLLVKSKGLQVKDENDKIISMLPVGTDIKISGDTQNGSLVELIEIIGNGKPTIPLPEGKNKVLFDGLKKHVRPQKYNEVVILDKPFPIKAGDLIGHVGHINLYNTAITKEIDKDTEKPIDIDLLPLTRPLKETEFRPNFHLECFTCDDLPNFIAQTQAEASKIADKDKTLLAISEQAKLLVAAKKADTNVGKPYNDTKLKILSKRRNIKWLQIEITTSETEKKTLWIENNKDIMSESEISLDEKTEAWTSHPLQLSDLSSSTSSVAIPLLLKLSDKQFQSRDNQAEDEQGKAWYRIEKSKKGRAAIKGWVAIDNQKVKKYSSWDWFDFKQIKETASLKEIYLEIEKSLARDNAALESYKPILKETLVILDKQFHPDQKKYAKIDTESFNGLVIKPHLSSALTRLLIHYESEWYSEIDAEGKMPKWEELNSEMNENNKNLLGYLQTGDETKLNAYLDKTGKSTDLFEANKHKKDRETISTFPADYKDNPNKKLNDKQKESNKNLIKLENDVMKWVKEKEKIKKLLWWSEVVKSQAKLNRDGKVWSIHPMAMLEIVISNDLIDVENFIAMYKLEHHKLIKASKDTKTKKDIIKEPTYDQESIEILREILKRINLFFRKNAEYPPNLYYLSYMLATGHWETNYAKEFDSFVERNNGHEYDPVLASTEEQKKTAKSNGNTEEGDGFKYRGRGLAQMTWKPNYKEASEYLNVDFINQPDKAAELDYAVPILIWGSINGIFSKRKLSKYINEDKIDYKLARYVINGQNYANEIAANAKCFEAILRQTSNLIEAF